MLTGGTFSANPLSAAAGLAALNKLNDDVYSKINHLSECFKLTLNEQFQINNIPFHADGYKSINRIYFTEHSVNNRTHRDSLEISPQQQTTFRSLLWREGVIWPTNGIVCMPTTQTVETLEQVIHSIIKAAKMALSNNE